MRWAPAVGARGYVPQHRHSRQLGPGTVDQTGGAVGHANLTNENSSRHLRFMGINGPHSISNTFFSGLLLAVDFVHFGFISTTFRAHCFHTSQVFGHFHLKWKHENLTVPPPLSRTINKNLTAFFDSPHSPPITDYNTQQIYSFDQTSKHAYRL